MGNMQACSCFLCKSDGQLCALVASLGIAYFRMVDNLRVFTIQRLKLGHTLINAIGIFAMCHYQGRAITEDVSESLFFIHQHIACAATHEELYAWYAMNVYVKDFLKIVVGGTQEEAIVNMALLCRHLVTFIKEEKGGCLRRHVRHVQHSCNTSCCCRTGWSACRARCGASERCCL